MFLTMTQDSTVKKKILALKVTISVVITSFVFFFGKHIFTFLELPLMLLE